MGSHSEAVIANKVGKYAFAPKLSEDAKHRICELFAHFHTAKVIQQRIEQEFKVKLHVSAIHRYPKEKKWKPLVDRLRQEWAEGMMEMPLAHKRGRMEELVHLYNRVQRPEAKLTEFTRITQSLAILTQMHKEMDERHTNFTTIFATAIHNYSDEELLTRRNELLTRLDELRGNGHQKVIDIGGGHAEVGV